MLDPYVYPGTEVLINKFDIRDVEELSQAEIAANLLATSKGFPSGKFDLEHLKNIHRHAFQYLYTWAGEIRTVDITKGDSTFCRSNFIERELSKLLNHLATKDQLLTKYPNKGNFVQTFASYCC